MLFRSDRLITRILGYLLSAFQPRFRGSSGNFDRYLELAGVHEAVHRLEHRGFDDLQHLFSISLIALDEELIVERSNLRVGKSERSGCRPR
jgi:hypothetical protein